VTLFGPLNYL